MLTAKINEENKIEIDALVITREETPSLFIIYTYIYL